MPFGLCLVIRVIEYIIIVFYLRNYHLYMYRLTQLSRGKKILLGLLIIVVALLSLLMILRLAYIGRVYPGVTANGVYLGGLTRSEAIKEMNNQTQSYSNRPVEIIAMGQKQPTTASQLGVIYNNQAAVDQALKVGRGTASPYQLAMQFYYLIGLGQPIVDVNYDTTKLSDITVGINTLAAKPATNARFVSQNGQITIQDSTQGYRVDFGQVPDAAANHYGNLQTKQFVLPTMRVEPLLTTHILDSQRSIIEPFAKQPLQLTYNDKVWTINSDAVVSWLTAPSANQPVQTNTLTQQYSLKIPNTVLYYDKKSVQDYVASLASQINVEPVNAQLTIDGAKAVAFKTSRDGKTLDIEKSTQDILAKLSQGLVTPTPLTVAVTKAEVSDDNIDRLGIRELISEGVSYFPGSSANRIQNIRVGQSRFHNLLIRPDEVFSFNKYLGEVSAATGYAESVVILENKEEHQYGGGLCQVSSTAYRAALLAGLPIVSRTNHAFAVSYYTEPYGVPGVDATIYLPYPDMQFKNDTGHYILMQTEMTNSTLKFRFYGTKTKSGVIRGPFFVTGSNDHTQPSQTVFYRDVLDLSGKVIKTDTTTTYYKSSLEFPLVN